MPLRIRQLIVNRADEIRKAERGELDTGDVVFFGQCHEALSIEDGKAQRREVPGKVEGTVIVRRRTLREHEGYQDILCQCSYDV
jgi:hypothetical protein